MASKGRACIVVTIPLPNLAHLEAIEGVCRNHLICWSIYLGHFVFVSPPPGDPGNDLQSTIIFDSVHADGASDHV